MRQFLRRHTFRGRHANQTFPGKFTNICQTPFFILTFTQPSVKSKKKNHLGMQRTVATKIRLTTNAY